jgi:glycosyltransferase involved in cell wall biosynthesis
LQIIFIFIMKNNKNIVIYTGPAWEKWNRASVDAGMAGSETWAAEIGAEFVKLCFDVTLFNDCPQDGEIDTNGVVYRRYEKFSQWQSVNRIKYMIFSRTCEPLTKIKINSDNIYVMVHDICLYGNNGSDIGIQVVKKYACLSDWHIEFFMAHHNVPACQIFLTANGVREELYGNVDHSQKKNMAVYSSSLDRGLRELLKMLPAIKKEVPDFELIVAYGFHNWELAAKMRNKPAELAHIAEVKVLLKQPGVNYVGRVDKQTLADLQKRAKVWLYPTWFSETWAISLVEQGFAGNAIVTTPYAGMLTTGGNAPVYINGPKELPPSLWSTTPAYQENFISQSVRLLKDEKYRREIADRVSKQTKKYTWKAAALTWLKEWGEI